jgi:PAS domain S-box-containing protein
MLGDEAPGALDSLLWRLPVAAYRTTPAGRFTAGNPRLLELIGATSMDELSRLDVRSLYVEPDERGHMVRRAAAGETIPPEEIRLRRLDGSEIWVRVSSQSVMAPDGTVQYYEGVLEDVTARRQADLRLTESNRLLDAVAAAQNRFLTGVDVGIVLDDLLDALISLTNSEYGFIAEVLGEGEARYLRSMAMTNIAWNDATREMFDRLGPRGMEFHNLDTLFGRVVLDGTPVVSNDPVSDPRQGGRPHGHPPLDSFLGVPVFKGASVIAVVALANRPGGYSDSVAQFLEPFLSTVGSILEAIRDRRARSEAEERERIRELRFRAVVDAAVDAVIVLDDAGIVEAFNPAAEQLFGYRAEETIGRDIRSLVSPDIWTEQLASLASEALGLPEEMTALHRSGDEVPVEVSLGSFRLDGRTTVTAVVRDITERKVTEDALRRAKDAAERASRSKDEFLAGMSHELRTPLNGVIGLSSILARGTHGPLTDKQHEYVTQIGASGRHLLSLINDVLDLAKIEADRLEPELAPVDVAAMSQQALGMVREVAVSKDVRFQMDLPGGLPKVMADERRTRQVLVNLIGNAVKFTPAGGQAGVSATAYGDRIVVAVWDTGIGIPSDRLEDVFLPFQQVESTLDRRHDGTGLGLALSRRLIESQGGGMRVESVVGEGSRFEFWLPVADPHPESSDGREVHPDEPMAVTAGSRRVLVVEDNDVNRMLVTDYLEAHGFHVLTATDGDEAVARALDSAPDVILMDIQMPRRDGLSATRELKQRPETASVPVIALTALAMKGDADRCLQAGCDDYLSKPCDPAVVLRTVERHLGAAARF